MLMLNQLAGFGAATETAGAPALSLTGVQWSSTAKGSGFALSDGNLTALNSTSSTTQAIMATTGASSGAIYFELRIGSAANIMAGLCVASQTVSGGAFIGSDTNGYGYYWANGNKYHGAGGVAHGASFTLGDILGVAVNFTTGNLWFAKNGVWQTGGNPATGVGPAFTGLSGTLYPAISGTGDTGPCMATLCAAPANWAYSAPAGFTSLS